MGIDQVRLNVTGWLAHFCIYDIDPPLPLNYVNNETMTPGLTVQLNAYVIVNGGKRWWAQNVLLLGHALFINGSLVPMSYGVEAEVWGDGSIHAGFYGTFNYPFCGWLGIIEEGGGLAFQFNNKTYYYLSNASLFTGFNPGGIVNVALAGRGYGSIAVVKSMNATVSLYAVLVNGSIVPVDYVGKPYYKSNTWTGEGIEGVCVIGMNNTALITGCN
ncbi:hypothetical protein [Vulcanisaeta thermophila]|uniref:hypothetical protein n=1 Tax=Vulcanisaeta thermophila TaxID=867917 RepID=UPI000852E027|nr:hypothetical protein [Vulcanisaeta thermophila]